MPNDNRLLWLRTARPFAWVAAVFFFAIAEGLIIAAELNHHLYSVGSFRFWFAPIMSLLPLLSGSAFERSVRTEFESRGSAETGVEVSAMVGMVVIGAYTAMVCTLCIFL